MLCKMIFVPKTHTHIPIVEYTISLSFIFWLHRLFFGVSALTFRCKFCIPLGMSFELLRLLFRWYLRWLFALRLIFWRYLALHSLWNDFWAENLHYINTYSFICGIPYFPITALENIVHTIIYQWLIVEIFMMHSLWNDFWAENLHCAPLGTTFCSFGKLTLRSVERLFVASEILVM